MWTLEHFYKYWTTLESWDSEPTPEQISQSLWKSMIYADFEMASHLLESHQLVISAADGRSAFLMIQNASSQRHGEVAQVMAKGMSTSALMESMEIMASSKVRNDVYVAQQSAMMAELETRLSKTEYDDFKTKIENDNVQHYI